MRWRHLSLSSCAPKSCLSVCLWQKLLIFALQKYTVINNETRSFPEYMLHKKTRMYEVAPSILESRLLGSNNIVDAAVVGIPDKENGQVKTRFLFSQTGE